jgi:alanyl-tRNA synthetase
MGADGITIDFDGVIPPEALPALEKEANEALWQNLAVSCTVPSPEELEKTFYRTKRALPWPVRIVQVPGYDSCACCGVHVARTGEVGIIKILSGVKFHQGIRLEMLCGRRAYEFLGAVYDQNRLVSQAFSAKVLQTGAAARRMNEQLSAEKIRAASLEKKLFAMIARDYENAGDVVRFEENLTPGAVRELADAIAGCCGGVAAVFSGSDEAGYNVCMIGEAARVKGLGDLCKTLGGRGGGKPGSFQGSIQATRQAIEEALTANG